jgi:Putative metallopeptidase
LKEEDAVDQLATLILIEGSEDGEKAVLDASIQYLAEYQAQGKTPLTKEAFADEHSLNAQRFYNLLCRVYGHNEKIRLSGQPGHAAERARRALRRRIREDQQGLGPSARSLPEEIVAARTAAASGQPSGLQRHACAPPVSECRREPAREKKAEPLWRPRFFSTS